MAYNDLFKVVPGDDEDVVYKIVKLEECIHSVMHAAGKQIIFAYTPRFHCPAGNGWVGREDVDEDGKRGMVWKLETEDTKTGSAA